MKLSVIIVNYNVAFFLEQCLNSVFASTANFEYEVFVVDNNSVDNSLEMIAEKYPLVHLLANKENLGFSKANNQAMRICKGEYVLLLNPDTLIEVDTLQKVVDFMDAHLEGGGLGVKMVDGKGNYLPESKRGLPTPAAAFYKIFGFSTLFPKNKHFSAYHLGHLDQDAVHEIDILSGAFMLMRKSVLDQVGLLDEDFFMYGEDIDLSYRIQLGGYKNYYFPETRIIHYKGESTKKDSLNYVFVFYRAMIIFARKHFSKKNAGFFSLLINMAIVFKAGLSITSQMLRRFSKVLIDFVLIYAGLFAFAAYWGPHFASQSHAYPSTFLYGLIPLYILIDLLSVYYSGGYDRPLKFSKMLRGHVLGIMAILALYALLPENYRFSRALVLFSALYIPLVSSLWRWLLSLGSKPFIEWEGNIRKRFLLVGEHNEISRVKELLDKTSLEIDAIIDLEPQEKNLQNLGEIVKIEKINEVIFCAKDMASARIIDMMTTLQHLHIDFKIAPPESLFIIGSNSINSAGDIYLQELNAINKLDNRRYKRLFDVFLSLFLLLTFPIGILFQKKPIQYLRNIALIFIAAKSFVGFNREEDLDIRLPIIKRGVLTPEDGLKQKQLTKLQVKRVNMLYARDYKLSNDITIVWRGFRKLGA
jgi:GT2 family glycosyltransferase